MSSEATKAKYRRYNAKRRARPEHIEGEKRRHKNWYDAHKDDPKRKERQVIFMREYRTRPEERAKEKARQALNYALSRGNIHKGLCEVCGSPKVHGHHDDYSKPLAVRWLCHGHHREHHSKIAKENHHV